MKDTNSRPSLKKTSCRPLYNNLNFSVQRTICTKVTNDWIKQEFNQTDESDIFYGTSESQTVVPTTNIIPPELMNSSTELNQIINAE